MKKFLNLCLLIIILLVGCSRAKIMKNINVEQKMQYGDKYFAKKKYNIAAEYYSDIIYDRNSIFTAKAQMRLADCYFQQNKFSEARFEYEELIRLFPDYEETGLAYYMIGICSYEESLSPHYTQEETKYAIDAFTSFIEKFPNDPNIEKASKYIEKCKYKLLEKEYWNGYAYFKIYDYSSALMYFQNIISKDMNDEIDKKSLYYSALIYLARKDISNAEKIISKLAEKYPDSKETFKVKIKLEKLK